MLFLLEAQIFTSFQDSALASWKLCIALHYSQSLTVHQNSGSNALNVLRPKFRFGSASFDSCCLPVLAWELPATICSKRVFFLQQLKLLAKPCAIWIHLVLHLVLHLVPVDASRSSTCPSSGQSQCYFAVLIQEYPGNLLKKPTGIIFWWSGMTLLAVSAKRSSDYETLEP